MKKLKLVLNQKSSIELLTREQLKVIMGGSDGSGTLAECSVTCGNGETKTRKCGSGIQCSTEGTSIFCGSSDKKEMCG